MDNYRRIVVFSNSTFTERDYKRFGLDSFIKNNFRVEIFDFSPLLNKKVFKEFKPNNIYKGSILINSKKHARELLKSLHSNDLVYMYMPLDYKTLWVFRRLRIRKVEYIITSLGAIPLVNFYKRSLIRLVRVSLKIISNPVKLFDILCLKLPNKILGINGAKYIVCIDQNQSQNSRYYSFEKTEYILAHAYDYDIFLKDKDVGIDGDYIVFLDEYGPFHPDFLTENVKPDCGAADTYYPYLCRYFDFIEKESGKKVIIAGHPKSDYKGKENLLGYRNIVYGKTIELVKNAYIVIGHASTSLNFAALYNKKVILLTSGKYTRRYKLSINSVANELGCKIIDLDNDFVDEDSVPRLDSLKYEYYKESYIKKAGTEESTIAEIICKRLNLSNH